jgi:mono/diheme cytochrome c family protein
MEPPLRALRAATCCLTTLLAAGCGGSGGAPADRGAVVYATHCASCHGRDGTGVGRNPPLAGSVTVSGDPQVLAAWIIAGERPPTLPKMKGLVVMPQYRWLADEDLAAVITHIRTRFGNASSAVTPAEIAALRASLPAS